MKLKMNMGKTEFIIFGGSRQLNKSEVNEVEIEGSVIQRSQMVRCLGAWLDDTLSMKHHVKVKARVAMLNLLKIKNIRRFLNRDACQTLVHGLVTSHLDYCNAILTGLPNTTLKLFENIQAMSAKTILSRSKFSSTTEAYMELHWLPVHFRIKFKVVCLVHKALYGLSPSYIKDLLTIKPTLRGGLRSSSERVKLIVPFTKNKTFAQRSFSVQGPLNWNGLTEELRTIQCYDTFKSKLKTYYFNLFISNNY